MISLVGCQAKGPTMTADYQRVIAIITARVADGAYPPGSRLPTIRELAEEFDCGETTVKLAITVLRANGTVVGRQGKGLYAPESDISAK